MSIPVYDDGDVDDVDEEEEVEADDETTLLYGFSVFFVRDRANINYRPYSRRATLFACVKNCYALARN